MEVTSILQKEQAGVSQQYIAHAAVVFKYRPDLADDVISGVKPLNEAYAEAPLIFVHERARVMEARAKSAERLKKVANAR